MDILTKTVGKKRGTTDVDALLGEKIRALRLQAGWSQSELASQLNVSFQQVQKYEKGSNRLSAASLYQISQLFGLPLNHFFDDGVGRLSVASEGPRLAVGSRAEARLIAAFRKVSPDIRQRFLALVEASASLEPDDADAIFED